MDIFLGFFGVGLFFFMAYWIWQMNRPAYNVPAVFPAAWREALQKHIHFYQNLDERGKRKFEQQIRNFLKQVRITGIRTAVTDLDRLLCACSAVIPLFAFPGWKYNHLHEVLLYPASFDRNFSMDNPEEVISGMVGSGSNMDGVMILNKKSLHEGFKNTSDKHNVGIHEFVHILDKQDGEIDGVPGVLNNKAFAKPWLQLMHREMERIRKGRSDIDEYAATSEEEFLSVASEYFFERPGLFLENHPELYQLLKKVYHQDMVSRLRNPCRKPKRIGRNEACPCSSGEKFKKCCMNNR